MSHDTEASLCLACTHFSPQSALVHTPSIRESGAKHKRVHIIFHLSVSAWMHACAVHATNIYVYLWRSSLSRAFPNGCVARRAFYFLSAFSLHLLGTRDAFHSHTTYIHTLTIARLFSPLVGRIFHRSVFGERICHAVVHFILYLRDSLHARVRYVRIVYMDMRFCYCWCCCSSLTHN